MVFHRPSSLWFDGRASRFSRLDRYFQLPTPNSSATHKAHRRLPAQPLRQTNPDPVIGRKQLQSWRGQSLPTQRLGYDPPRPSLRLATELITGKTPEEALALKTEELAGELGPLPPMKIHCAQLVEGALRSALRDSSAAPDDKASPPATGELVAPLDNLIKSSGTGKKIKFLE